MSMTQFKVQTTILIKPLFGISAQRFFDLGTNTKLQIKRVREKESEKSLYRIGVPELLKNLVGKTAYIRQSKIALEKDQAESELGFQEID